MDRLKSGVKACKTTVETAAQDGAHTFRGFFTRSKGDLLRSSFLKDVPTTAQDRDQKRKHGVSEQCWQLFRKQRPEEHVPVPPILTQKPPILSSDIESGNCSEISTAFNKIQPQASDSGDLSHSLGFESAKSCRLADLMSDETDHLPKEAKLLQPFHNTNVTTLPEKLRAEEHLPSDQSQSSDHDCVANSAPSSELAFRPEEFSFIDWAYKDEGAATVADPDDDEPGNYNKDVDSNSAGMTTPPATPPEIAIESSCPAFQNSGASATNSTQSTGSRNESPAMLDSARLTAPPEIPTRTSSLAFQQAFILSNGSAQLAQNNNKSADMVTVQDAISTITPVESGLHETPILPSPTDAVDSTSSSATTKSSNCGTNSTALTTPEQTPPVSNQVSVDSSRCLRGFRKLCRKVAKPLRKLHHKFSRDRAENKDQEDEDEDNEAEEVDDDECKEKKRDKIFAVVAAADEDAILKVALTHRPGECPDSTPDISRARIVDRKRGSNNQVWVIQFDDDYSKICVRIPACGYPGKWTEHDEYSLRSQVFTLKTIEAKTKLPVPHIYGWSFTTENELGMAYLVMSFIEGRSVSEVWYTPADDGNPPYEIRENILRSVANCMAELRHLSFDQLGFLQPRSDTMNIDEFEIGPVWYTHFGLSRASDFCDNMSHALEDPQENSFINLRLRLAGYFDDEMRRIGPEAYTEAPPEAAYIAGLFWILKMALNAFPGGISFGNEETFALAPSDFDAQNIHIDDNGNVTGILDWDRVATKPRYQGWSMTPWWINTDWDTEYWYDFDATDISRRYEGRWLYEDYRTDYARFLSEAAENHPDCIFTERSPIFNSIAEVIMCGDTTDKHMIVCKILASVVPSIDPDEIHETISYFGKIHLNMSFGDDEPPPLYMFDRKALIRRIEKWLTC